MRFFLIFKFYAGLVMKIVVIAKKEKKDGMIVYLLTKLYTIHDSPTYRTLLAFSASILKITLSFVAWT